MPRTPYPLALVRSRFDSALPQQIQTLQRFGVPFLAYAVDGQRSHTSPAAARLLEDSSRACLLGRHADAVAAEELGVARSEVGLENGYSRREVASVAGIGLSFHWLDDRGWEPVAIIVLHPEISSRAGRGSIPGLSERQSEVAYLVAAGLATKEIAARLGISEHTARHHVERIFARLRIRSRLSLAAVVGAYDSKIA